MQCELARSYLFYGCRLQSALPLSFVPEITADNRAPDVVIAQGEVPGELPDPVWESPFVSIGSDDRVLIQVDAVGRFLVQGGHTITVETAPEATPVALEAFLLGPVAGVLLHQRGVLPLHASCVEIGGVAIAMAGSVGRGKSTLAAALVRSGAVLMSDDICPVAFCPDAAPLAIPGSAGLRLWPDSQEVFVSIGPEWSPIRPGHTKQVGGVFALAERRAPRPLRAVIRLKMANLPEPEIRRLHGPTAVWPMSDLIYRLGMGRVLGRDKDLFSNATRLADEVPFFELQRPHGFNKLDRMADMILSAVRGAV